MNPGGELLHNGTQQPLPDYHRKSLLGSSRFQDLQRGLPGQPSPQGIGGQNLPPAVGPSGVGVHDPGCHLHKFADMGNKQDALDSQLQSHIDGLAHKVTAFDAF